MSYYGSRFHSGGVSYYSGFDRPARTFGSGRTRHGERNRFAQGSHRLNRNELFFKYRRYAPEDSDYKKEGPRVLKLGLKKELNREKHRTSLYGNKNLIIRRGQEFEISLEIDVPFNKDQDGIQMMFAKGETPQETKGTLVQLSVANSKDGAKSAARPTDWIAYIKSINSKSIGSVIDIIIIPSHTALVGSYKITSKVYGRGLAGNGKTFVKEEPDEELIVLFNAWCKDDQVYMEDSAQRDEYIMNETGKIWVGSANRNNGRPWAFSQFSKYCLNAAIFLLEKSSVKDEGHGNVIRVSRALSAMTNSCDSKFGVLTGNWSGSYGGGTSPTAWTGSKDILEKYMLTKRSVQYGQCWVFSGLLTTLGRTLGIPTRSVTNFESAHDKDFSYSIDTHFDYTFRNIKELDDSVWNFHVWNEAWFKRFDLPDGCDGWQAFDATPQEESDGKYRCGPASVKAIKEGNVYLNHDGGFIFAEVNGDKVYWIGEKNEGFHPVKCVKDAVGKNISTKSVGSPFRQDLTLDYKYKEGTKAEREAVSRAAKYSSRKEGLEMLERKGVVDDVDFKYESPVSPKGDIHIKVTAKNTSTEVRNLKLIFASYSVSYTGVIGMDLDEDERKEELQPGDTQTYMFDLESKNYLNIIDEDAKIKMFVTCFVLETNQAFLEDETIHVDKPELEMEVSNKRPRVGEQIDVTMRFQNPLDLGLTQCSFVIEGPGIQKSKKINLLRNIKVGEVVEEKVTLTPKYPGNREVIAVFNSRQLVDVAGTVEVQVQKGF